eukprot:6814503-Prymnesium_polylepis.1
MATRLMGASCRHGCARTSAYWWPTPPSILQPDMRLGELVKTARVGFAQFGETNQANQPS